MAKRHQVIEVDGRELKISNLNKIFFPETGFTKGEVLAFYSEIAGTIVPHLRDRPLTLKRYPDGITGEHFYEKNAPKHTPAWVETFAVPRSEGEGEINYVLCNDRATLVWATNLADIEKHVLLAQAPDLHRPTSIVFDLDPGEPAGLLDCGEIALQLKRLFEQWGLESFVKVSGSKGLHLSVPLNGNATYELTQPFAKTVAELMARQLPKGVVSEMAKSLRGGKVFIDWSQNSDFKTTVGVYAMRAKNDQPFVSVPISWDELARAVKRKEPKHLSFTPDATIKRISKEGDLFEPVLTLKQELPTSFSRAVASGPEVKLHRWPRNTKAHKDGRLPQRNPKPGSSADKSLRGYEAKRKFERTPEPPPRAKPERKTRTEPRRFIIQKHAASHLHYDFRLEMQGVLRSWAVPKGPPTKVRESRLAVHVEDHPLEYGEFEGTIPPGNYGAGTVMLWDTGLYDDLTGSPAAAFHKGKLHLVMEGQKLKGEWILVKDNREPESNRWLLIKAGESMKPISARQDDRSAVSGRSMAAIARANDAQWQSNRPATAKTGGTEQKGRGSSLLPAEERRAEPRFFEPMQCKAVTRLPTKGNWTFEIKFDGYRCIALKIADEVRVFSRNKKSLNGRFPNVVEALSRLPGDFTLDGEIVALDDKGRPSFQLLQNNMSRVLDVYLYVFDLLNHDGEELISRRIEERRALLQTLLAEVADPLRCSPLLQAPAGEVLDAVRKLGLEGVVGKRDGSSYEAGERSGAWIKQRTSASQEFVIGGYKPGARGFESLLVGVYADGALNFVARVKDGFVPRVRDEIFAGFDKLRTDVCPFANLPEKKGARRGDALTAEKMRECRWLKPKLICQVAFVEWTDAGNLRHPAFVAMRDDKPPRKTKRET